MAVDDELDVLEEQPARRPWWSRLWNLARSDWPATSLAVVAMVVAAILVQQVRDTQNLRDVVADLRAEEQRAGAQSCRDRNDARDALRAVLQGIITAPETSEGARALLLAQLPKVAAIDCATGVVGPGVGQGAGAGPDTTAAGG